jgi:hypothetical protein
VFIALPHSPPRQLLTDSERTVEANKYWVLTHGDPYLIVEETDDTLYTRRNESVQEAVASLRDADVAAAAAPAASSTASPGASDRPAASTESARQDSSSSLASIAETETTGSEDRDE